ncbi:hypothetical protein [Kitasatospora sp. NPDC050463]|uniref:hypothetical protein n=1 Tax=Kitasatospora sp. NPDC050463 TaxID=3155786 RepID=UPI00340BDB4C
MTDTYQRAINGTLVSGDAGYDCILEIVNDTPVHLDLFWINDEGDHVGYNRAGKEWRPGYPGVTVDPGGGSFLIACEVGTYWIAKVTYSGAFVSVIDTWDGPEVAVLSGLHLLDPNNIGGVPEPNSRVIIPPDGPGILVGAGVLPNRNTVTREQFWQRLPDSYSLAPHETRAVNFTISTGMQQSSSNTKTAADSVSTSARAGWGPFSASVSASLSKSSTSTQQVTVSTQQTSVVSTTYVNDGDSPVMFLNWQLTDVVTVFSPKGRSLSSVVSAATPTVVWGPRGVDELKSPSSSPAAQDRADDWQAVHPRLLELHPAVDPDRQNLDRTRP